MRLPGNKRGNVDENGHVGEWRNVKCWTTRLTQKEHEKFLALKGQRSQSVAMREALMQFQLTETMPKLENVVSGFVKWVTVKLNADEYKKLGVVMAKYDLDVIDAFRVVITALPN